MSNLKDYARGRNDGLAMALRIVESEGIEGLRKEIRFRGVTGIHTALAKKELDQATVKIKEMTLDTMVVIAIAIEETRRMESSSVGLIHTSIPFLSMHICPG